MEMRADKCLDTYECLAANLIHTDPPISLHKIKPSDMQKKLRKFNNMSSQTEQFQIMCVLIAFNLLEIQF